MQKADSPSIGLCLDTFQVAAGEYGDPCSGSGLIENRGMQQKLEMNFKASLISLVKDVPPEKIFMLQISDAYKMPESLEDKVVDGLRRRGRWSHDYRPYPFNGGYLPMIDVTKAVLETGMRTWFSIECFDGGILQRCHGKPEAITRRECGSGNPGRESQSPELGVETRKTEE